MKAFLLAAGQGTRLRPITNTIPKCLVPIRGIPLLSIWLEVCRKFGIDEILVNIHAHAALVRDFLRVNANGIRAQVVEEEELLGSAGTLRHNQDWIAAEELFWVFYADVLCQPDLGEMLELHLRRKPTATLGVYEVPDPSRCGIVSTDADGIIQQFVEKPSVPIGNLAFAGVMIATPAIIESIPHNGPADIGFHVLPRLIGRMQAFRISSYVIDIGTMENYQTAQRTWPGLSYSG
jgi:mannose-1-phosphate guanylyltransferase